MKRSHFIIFLMIVINFQEPSFVPKYLIKAKLLINIVYKELHKYPSLAFVNDCIDQF